ncbi:MAG TPA: DUF6335 family protein [Candidatus Binatia bacterium]|nr:DUF6335 family protein [Candidatus Binatia bacterium]
MDDLEIAADTSILEDDSNVQLSTDAAHTPVLTGGDIDAAWDKSDSGEEAVGGSNPTPDQDMVDELGEAVGVTYPDEHPLALDKVDARDEERWELDPASAEDFEERAKALAAPVRPARPRRK